VEIQIPIKSERVVQLAHQLVPEVNFRQTFFLILIIIDRMIEFTPSSPAILSQDQIISTNIIVPPNQIPSLNICMMCVNNPPSVTPHENPHITMQTDFVDVKSLASRLIAAIHSDEVEKKLLRFERFILKNLKYFLFLV
jgi:hypothetical protein